VWRRHSQLSSCGAWDQILAQADAAGEVHWRVSIDSTSARVHQHAATLSRGVALMLPSHTGGRASYIDRPVEPVDHAIGRSRGGLTTNLHALVDGRGRPLVVHAGPGHANDSPMLPVLLSALEDSPARSGAGAEPARGVAGRQGLQQLRPSQVAATSQDQDRDTRAVGPDRPPAPKGSRGGRPVNRDRDLYKHRNVIERGFNVFKQWRGLASRYDKLAVNYRGGAVFRTILIWTNDLCVTPP
jgi:transposase